MGGTTSRDFTSWTALLAFWTEFARTAVALPETREGDAWRASVAPAIGLHAIASALGELDRLAREEHAVAMDRAEVGIKEHARTLHAAWAHEPLPEALAELITDARTALEAAASAGSEWIVVSDELVVPELSAVGERLVEAGARDVLAAEAGTILSRGEPVLFVRPAGAGADALGMLAGVGLGAAWTAPRQVYRQTDPPSGGPDARIVADLVAPLLTALPPGRPVLTALIEDGAVVRRDSSSAALAWRSVQERMMAERPLPVMAYHDDAT
jgi:hypothetical protein